MPLLIKRSGSWVDLSASDTVLRRAGTNSNPVSGFIKFNSVWSHIWTGDTSEDTGGETGGTSNSPLPAGVPRWGIAQFSDTDFTGGKTDPNQAGQPYQRWSGPQQFIDDMLQSNNAELLMDIDVPYPDYAYFAMKASDGTALFIDNDTGWPGGWDGATWADGEAFGTVYGPVTVTYDDGTGPADWLVYRTDYSGIGPVSYTVQINP